MKRYGYLFERIVDKDNLLKAHKNARRGKSKYKEVQQVDAHIEYYVDKLHNMLINGEFTTSEYEVFTKDDKGKSREIYKLPYFPDRVVQHALMQIMEPIWRGMLIKQTYQSIKGRGVHKALKDLQKGLASDSWVVKVDIRKYYPSINNDKLYTMLIKKIKCNKTKELIYDIVYSIKGVPIGNYTSQYFGNIYLSELDKELRQYCEVYSRYCDDIVCIVSSKDIGNTVLQLINTKASSLGLVVKPCQQVWNLQCRCMDYLRYNIHYKFTIVRKRIATNYIKSINAHAQDRVNGYNGWLAHANCYNLRRMYENTSK